MPNWLTAPAVLAGLTWSTWHAGVLGLMESLAACILLALPYIVLFACAGGGAGDAKWMGAIGAWIGLVGGLATLTAVAAAGVLLGLATAMARGQIASVLVNLKSMTYGLWLVAGARARLESSQAFFPDQGRMETMPYGVAIISGVCVAAGGAWLCGY